MKKLEDADDVPQELVAVTATFPDAAPINTIIEFVPWPELIVDPGGTVQVYEVAPETAGTVNETIEPAQVANEPLIKPGVAGVELIVIA